MITRPLATALQRNNISTILFSTTTIIVITTLQSKPISAYLLLPTLTLRTSRSNADALARVYLDAGHLAVHQNHADTLFTVQKKTTPTNPSLKGLPYSAANGLLPQRMYPICHQG